MKRWKMRSRAVCVVVADGDFRVSSLSCCIITLSLVLISANVASAELLDWGDTTVYFYDTDAELYWYDPATFVGMNRSQIDEFVAANPNWKLATSKEIDRLLGASSSGGTDLVKILGEPQYTSTDRITLTPVN